MGEIHDSDITRVIGELHLDQSAASRVPVEVWITIFEYLTKDDWNVDIFDQSSEYRHAINQKTRTLHLVCRKWRDAATMINCFNYRHLTFSNLEQGINGPLIEVHRFERFAERIFAEAEREHNESQQVESFYIQRAKRYETPRNEADIILGEGFQSLLPEFSHLTEFACHMFISVEEFDTFTAITAHSLRKLSVDFDYRLPDALNLFNRLSKLEDLSLFIIQELQLRQTRARPVLPCLRRFELHASRWDSEYALKWLTGLETSVGLQTLRLTGNFADRYTLQDFLQRQGTKIHTLGLYNPNFGQLLDRNWMLPSLETLEIGMSHIGLDVFLDSISSTMNTAHGLTHLVLYQIPGEPASLVYAIKCAGRSWPRRDELTGQFELSPVTRVSVKRHAKYMDCRKLGWKEYFANSLEEEKSEEMLRECTEELRNLMDFGVTVVDEEGVDLMDFVEELMEGVLVKEKEEEFSVGDL